MGGRGHANTTNNQTNKHINTGATGLIGSRLSAKLAAQGNKVRVLTRNTASAKGKLQYPGLEFFAPSQWAEAVKGCDAVVNLAGTPIGTRCVVVLLLSSVC